MTEKQAVYILSQLTNCFYGGMEYESVLLSKDNKYIIKLHDDCLHLIDNERNFVKNEIKSYKDLLFINPEEWLYLKYYTKTIFSDRDLSVNQLIESYLFELEIFDNHIKFLKKYVKNFNEKETNKVLQEEKKKILIKLDKLYKEHELTNYLKEIE